MNTNFLFDVQMFFIGAILGIFFHFLMDYMIYKFHINTDFGLGIIGVFQLILIAIVIRAISSILPAIGLFIFGIISAQDLIITRLYPRVRNKID